jgi:hypothetical protein
VTDPNLTGLLRYRLVSPAHETPDCLDDATLAALADGSLDSSARAAALPHVAICPRCRGIVASVARSLADPHVTREHLALRVRERRRVWLIGLPAAAAVTLLVIALPRWLNVLPGRHRGPPASAPQPVPLSPVGTVAAADTFRWSSHAGADRYRLALFDVAGHVLYETQLADTDVALPDSVRLAPARLYLWKVEARTAPDRWSESDLVRFSIAPAPAPPPAREPR